MLVWDLDLAAPGLHQIMRCKWQGSKLGFLDYVERYLENVALDDIKNYIHPTAVEGVDIIPAGMLGRSYAARLEQVKWREIYQKARGFDFIEAIRKQINEIEPKYDYVLIDSLTGFSDVGGICVRQLADIVVLLFRLNRQNLVGISRVYNSLRRASPLGMQQPRSPAIVPVISPSWPFASEDSGTWFERPRRIFGEKRILTLSFEGSLTLGERILTKQIWKYGVEPPVVRDYRILTRRIRDLNPQDFKTAFESIDSLRNQEQFLDALNVCLRLVQQRPDREKYWNKLVSIVSEPFQPALQKELRKKAIETINAACEARVALAFVARARLTDAFDGNWERSLGDLTTAIQISPEVPTLYFARARAYSDHKEDALAIADYSHFIEAAGNDARVATAYYQRAICYRSLEDFERARIDLTKALDLSPDQATNWLVTRAKLSYFCHDYDMAWQDAERALKLNPADEYTRVLHAHLLCVKGLVMEAQKELAEIAIDKGRAPGTVCNIAEAYLLVDPAKALQLVSSPEIANSSYKLVALFLRGCAGILLGDEEVQIQVQDTFEIMQQLETDAQQTGHKTWGFREIKEFVHWALESERITVERGRRLQALIQLFESYFRGSSSQG